MQSIYQEIILEHYKNPRNFGTIKNPSNASSLYNPLCGDKVEMFVVIKNDKVSDIKFSGKGCAISQASASLLTDYAKGKRKEDLKKLDRNFMIRTLGIELGPNRIKCALLPLEALYKLISL